jgi:hypothetical protein
VQKHFLGPKCTVYGACTPDNFFVVARPRAAGEPTAKEMHALLSGLREMGFVESHNLTIVPRTTSARFYERQSRATSQLSNRPI